MPAKYRVAVIGHTGRGNYGHGLDTVWMHMPECELAAVADAHAGGREAAAKKLKLPPAQAYADYRQMLDKVKPQIVSIGPRWLDQHLDMVLAAAERGIHIYLEKPLCRNLAEADKMVAACQKHKVKLALAHQTRYSPKLQVIRDLMFDGGLGDLLEIRGRGKEDRRGGGEDLWVLGSHVMNLMQHFGGEPEWCFAKVRQDGREMKREDVAPGNEGIGPLAGDTIQAMYGMPDNVTAYFGSHRDARGGRFGVQMFFAKGVVELLTGFLPSAHVLMDPAWSPGRSGKSWVPISSAGVGKPEPLDDPHHAGGNVAACRDLIGAIEEDREPECSVYEGRATVEMICGVFASHLAGGPVPLPLKQRSHPLA